MSSACKITHVHLLAAVAFASGALLLPGFVEVYRQDFDWKIVEAWVVRSAPVTYKHVQSPDRVSH